MRTHFTCLLTLALGACNSTQNAQEQQAPIDPVAAEATEATEASFTLQAQGPHARPGFTTAEKEGRLWVFRNGSEHLAEFQQFGEPAKSITLIGVGPDGMTLRGAEKDVLKAFQYSQPGYYCEIVDGRMWIFELGDEGLSEFLTSGEPAKSVTLIGEGPEGMSLRGTEKSTLREFMCQKPGYHVSIADGRLWVFEEGSDGLAEFLAHGEPAKNVTLIGEGPYGMSLRGSSKASLRSYMYSQPGYFTQLAPIGDRTLLWVFRDGSEGHQEFLNHGEPAKSVTLIGEGPNGITLRGADKSVLRAYASMN